jgi:hypothetical protein
MSPTGSHFANINILGADYGDPFRFWSIYHGNGKVKSVFEDSWAGAKELQKL